MPLSDIFKSNHARNKEIRENITQQALDKLNNQLKEEITTLPQDFKLESCLPDFKEQIKSSLDEGKFRTDPHDRLGNKKFTFRKMDESTLASCVQHLADGIRENMSSSIIKGLSSNPINAEIVTKELKKFLNPIDSKTTLDYIVSDSIEASIHGYNARHAVAAEAPIIAQYVTPPTPLADAVYAPRNKSFVERIELERNNSQKSI